MIIIYDDSILFSNLLLQCKRIEYIILTIHYIYALINPYYYYILLLIVVGRDLLGINWGE